ncbi:MAG: right-handed parallel beta-helix repeat-containing protein [Verrucomicrobiales bacterium]|nr:right-handed parallel beta-helix repeat-containing protein [Verrucomicrobiales bacterium]
MPQILTVLLSAVSILTAHAGPGAEFFVANGGDDAHAGTHEKPYATLERARNEIRKLRALGPLPPGGVAVVIAGGTYELAQPLALNAQDSGTAEAPVVYKAQSGHTVRLTGGREVSGWQPVKDQTVLARLVPEARSKVVQADLRAVGVTDFGQMSGGFGQTGGPGLELFFQDQPMTLARGPNEGFLKIAEVLGTTPEEVRGTKGCKEGIFTYEGDRPSRWVGEPEAWVLGYWFWDWAEQRQRIESLDPATRKLTLTKPDHGYGYRKGQWFYGFNILAELDQPGEWYLDRKAGVLYFWPPTPIAEGRAVVSVLPTLLTVKNAEHLTFRGITFEVARGTGITISGGTDVQIVGCTLRNFGSWAVRVDGGRQHAVRGCDVYATGDGGISLDGGDRRTLTPASHAAENNHLHHWSRWNRMYRPALMLGGVGQRVANNLIHDSPHTAIGFGGNDHVIELNEIHDVCTESSDAGAIYAGRNWTMRGTVIRHNYLHHISGLEGQGCVGVYLDDQFCGTEIFGNVFYKVTRAAMIGGGRDCTIANNIFVDCTPATHVDARGLGWASGGFEGMKASFDAMPCAQPPWSTRYPQLPGILKDDPMAPKGNRIARNICVGGRWGDFEAKAKPLVTFQDNLLEQDPKFVAAEHQNFRLQEDSPAWKLAFQPIPLEKIGPYASGDRASWPVKINAAKQP